ncbi:hypothetical protein [uncultured Winogradskyella sp.]|uniref:hypothetical protein n=1 Tax=uncultured Winogradskyella sp. TaxID=395353 RepID=UPI002637E512|nr:hypothetical protein [uncultured Winogradskyella sp.]
MKKSIIYTVLGFALVIGCVLALKSCIIQNVQPEDCTIIDVRITKITEGTSFDIIFHDDGTDFYYINRGLEQGLNLEALKRKVLNKTVTLHLANIMGGITSEHISQMALDDEIIFTEFKN